MLIAIDGNEANIKLKVGVHQYASKVLWGLYRLQDNKRKFVIYLKKKPNADLPKETDFWRYKILKGTRFWILTKLMPELLKRDVPDVFFTPSHYLPPLSNVPMVCTIHDLGFLKFSEQFKKYDFWQLKYWSAISISVSKYIICPSKSTAKDIVRHYPFASKKVKIIYHGCDKICRDSKLSKNFVRQTLKKYRISKNYILFLSTLKPSKNVEGLLRAYKEISGDFDYQLVIAGKRGWLYESIFEKVKEFSLEKNVIFTDYVPEEDKAALISGAKAFVLPSFWEGFGMEILDAMSCGVPVVVSRVASIPEIVQGAGVYIDPYNIESIAKGIKKVLTMDTVKKNLLRKKGLKQAQKFSWEKCAKETLKVLIKASL